MFVVSMNNPVRGILYRSLQYEGVNGERESSMEVLHLICYVCREVPTYFHTSLLFIELRGLSSSRSRTYISLHI